MGVQALTIGAETRSGRIFNELAVLETRLRPAAGNTAVRRFQQAMNTAVLTAGTPHEGAL